MSPKILSVLCCVSVAALASVATADTALKVAPGVVHAGKVVPNDARNSPDAPYTVYNNFSTDPLNLYNWLEGGYYVAGPTNPVLLQSQWMALPFTTKAAPGQRARRADTAIGWISGVKSVRVRIYTDAGGVVGTPLAGQGAATATAIPDLGVCCGVTTVNYPAPGPALAPNTAYWLVADSTAAGSDTLCAWQSTYFYNIGGNVANGGWFTFSALVPAAKITGTVP